MILFNILESEDSYEDVESIITKVRKYSQQLTPLYSSTSHNILRCQFKLPLTTYCVVKLNQLHSCFCRLNLFSYLLIVFIAYFPLPFTDYLSRVDQHCYLRNQDIKHSLSKNKNIVVVVCCCQREWREKFRPERGFEPCSMRFRCRIPPLGLCGQL